MKAKPALDYIEDQKTTREIIKLAAEYQRKQQEKDSSPKAQNDTVANNLKNAVEGHAQGGDTYEVADDIKKADNVNITIHAANAKYRMGGR